MRYSPPPPHLGDRISSLYDVEHSAAEYNELERADRPQLRIMIAGSGHFHFANGRIDASTRMVVMGPTSGPVRGIGVGPMRVAGAGLLPPCWLAMMGREADAHVDCAIDGEKLFGAAGTDLVEAVMGADDTDARFAAICAFIDEQTQDANPEDVRLTEAVDAWLTNHASGSIEDLARSVGMSVRQLERRVKRSYGLPPKTLARKYRALRAALAMARGEDIAKNGIADDFYDQSHLIREVKRFAGMTPQQLRAQPAGVMTEHAYGRKALEGRVGKLVSDA